MTSLSTSYSIGSASGASVRDAIESYRRSQYLVAGSAVVSASSEADLSSDEEEDPEAQIGEQGIDEHDDYDYESENEDYQTPTDDFVSQLEWDEEDQGTSGQTTTDARNQQKTQMPPMKRVVRPTHKRRDTLRPLSSVPSDPPKRRESQVQENTPLLARMVSFDIPPRRPSTTTKAGETPNYLAAPTSTSSTRRPSSGSLAKSIKSIRSIAKSARHLHVGRSTFGQTLFNSVAILVGIGMLSEPLAFAYAGWFMGTVLIVSYGALSCYTAKILAHIIRNDPRLRSYSDIGRKAFGPRSTLFISFMFCLELFAVSVVLVTLYADSLHTIIPTYSANTYKVWGLLVFIPTVFLPLSLLSYSSILGIISSIMLIGVIFIDGISKQEAPGSFWDPADTNIGIASMSKLGLAFGLFMAGFSGHAVIPSLARDMIDPTQFDAMINWAFVIATVIYTLIGYAGYLMYGKNVSDEVSVDLLNTPGFNPLLNQAALWMLVLNPLSKFALNTQPLNATLEILLGLDAPVPTPEDVAKEPDSLGAGSTSRGSHANTKWFFAIVQRIVLTCMSVIVSIYIPGFSVMMAFLGSFSAFCLSIVGPILAKVKLERKCGWLDGIIIAIGIIMALWGTTAAIMDPDVSF